MNDIELHRTPSQTDLASQMDYARAVSEGSLLPDAYRGKPANVMIAVGLGQSMGLSPAESLYRIAVINGKPAAGAELIAANVRKAGHKLRVRVSENPPSCTAQIVRADDPDFPFEVTRDMEWVQRMGLANNPNYKKQPSTMLQWRAISAVARLACPEALYGVQYTPDEMGDMPSTGSAPASGGLAVALQTSGAEDAPDSDVVSPVEHSAPESDPVDVTDAEVLDDDPAATDLTNKTRKRLFALFNERGINDRDEQIRGISHIIGRPIASRSELMEADAQRVIDVLAAKS